MITVAFEKSSYQELKLVQECQKAKKCILILIDVEIIADTDAFQN